jgi:predicted Zn finger-like uncharacterized protein
MILTCPACSTRFSVDPTLLGSNGRKVRCSNCGHSWFQLATISDPKPPPKPALPSTSAPRPEPTPSIDAPAPPDPNEASPISDEAPARRRGGGLGWLLLILVIAGAAGGGFLFRNEIVRLWPPAAKLFELARAPLDNPFLGFELTGTTLTRDGGGVVLEGFIVNKASERRAVPPLVGRLVDPSGATIREVRFSLRETHLDAGVGASYRHDIPNVPGEQLSILVELERPPG